MDATLNSRTGKRFFKAPKNGRREQQGPHQGPHLGQDGRQRRAREREHGQPHVRVRLCGRVGRLRGHHLRRPVLASASCARCPSCASSGGSSPPSARSSRRPTLPRTRATSPTTAKTNGSWYIDACGPWGAELLPYGQWQGAATPRASREIDSRIFDSYAAAVIDLNARIGAGRDPHLRSLCRPRTSGSRSTRINMRGARARLRLSLVPQHARRGAGERARVRPPEKYHSLDSGSVGRTASHFLYDTYVLRNRTLTHARTQPHPKSHQVPVAGADGSSTRSSRTRAGGCTTWATSLPRAARTRSSARRTRCSA